MNDFLTQSHWIGKFTDKELSVEEESRLMAQASHNPLLRNELRLDEDINELFNDIDRIRLSDTIRSAIQHEKSRVIMPIYARIAASVIILITLAALAGLLVNYSRQNPGHSLIDYHPLLKPETRGLFSFMQGHRMQDMPATPAKRREIARNGNSFNPYSRRPEYEFLIGTVTRDVSIFVISPLPRVRCKAESLLQFSWRWVSDVVPVSIEVIDNKGHLMLHSQQMMDMSYVLNTMQWPRGLYYYKIITADELVTIGSISIY
jgi:hypothetical protein